jgi:uncharacterized cupin superfamily protein
VKVGDAAGLTQFGVNICHLPPGSWSALPHWHVLEDEFVYVLDGEVVLVCGSEEQLLKPGDCAGFKAGEEVGHCFQNRSTMPATLLEVGSRYPGEVAHYPGADLVMTPTGFTDKLGVPYPSQGRLT